MGEIGPGWVSCSCPSPSGSCCRSLKATPCVHAGVAVTFVMFMTTMIMTLAIVVVWGHNVLLALAFFLIFGLIDVSFLTAALSKFTHGGWFPIALSGRGP